MAQAVIEADPERVRRTLLNLIDNAVRYGGSAEVSLGLNGGVAKVTVGDRGPGLEGDQLEAVFEPFYRLERSRSRDTGGAGLGLAICRELAKADDGGILLRRRDGGGLEALLSIPCRGVKLECGSPHSSP